MMNKLIKVFGAVAVILLAGVLVVLVAATFLITPERVRQVVIPMAEERLNRPVSIGEIRIRIFSGIVISDFVIGSKDDTKDFVSAQALVLRYQFWPLLRFSVVVDEIRLDSPEIRVVRYENGEFNFSDLTAQKTGDQDTSEETAPEVQVDEPVGGRQIDLVVNELSISKGRLIFVDHMVKQEYQLSDLSVSVSDFSTTSSFPFDLAARVNNAPVDLSGIINPDTMHVSASIRVKDLDVAAIMPYAPGDFPGKISSLKLSADLKTEATGRKVDSSGRITLTDINMLFEDMPDTPVEMARANLDYNIGLDMDAENLTIAKAHADINGILLSATGNVLSYAKDPLLDLTAQMPMTSLSDLMASLPQQLVEPVTPMRPSGRIGAQVHVKGSPDKPEKLIEKGEITLEKITVAINQLTPEINGNIRLAKDTASSDNLIINLAGDRVRMDFTANNLLGKTIGIDNTITADKLNIDHLLSSLSPEKNKKAHPPVETTDKRPAMPEEPGPFDIPAQVKGDVRVVDAIYRGMAVNNLNLQYVLKNNVLTVGHLRGNVAGGTISGTARTELNRKPIAYTANISMEDTRAENIMNALFPRASNTVFGAMFLKADIRGEGTSWDTIRQKLSSRSDVAVTDGRVTGTGLAGGLADFLNTRRLEVLEFDSLKGNLKLENGNVNLDGSFTGNDIRMAPTGTIGLDGSLSLALNMRLAPEMASRIQIGRLVSQLAQTGDGWTLVPLGVTGTLWNPRFSLDTSAVSDQLMERGREELRRRLQDQVLDRLTPQSPDKTGKEPDKDEKIAPERIIQDTLRRLFN